MIMASCGTEGTQRNGSIHKEGTARVVPLLFLFLKIYLEVRAFIF